MPGSNIPHIKSVFTNYVHVVRVKIVVHVKSYEHMNVTLRKDLKASREGEIAGSAGRLFQSMAVLGKKDEAYFWPVHIEVRKRNTFPLVKDFDSLRY